jgi:glutamate transport system permease protein
MTSALYDVPGPKFRRRILLATILGVVLLAGGVALVLWRLASQGLLDADRWDVFQNADTWQFLWTGLLNTLKAAGVAAVLAGILGVVIAALRMSHNAIIRLPAMALIELFRGLPVLLLMFFTLIAFGTSSFWAVVTGLTIYNAAVIAEILRAGVVALPDGQREAGLAIGLTPMQVLLRIQLPQAVRNMMPSLVSQVVVLLKDTSLGFIVAYTELLRSVQNLRDFFGGKYIFSVFFVAAVIYIAVNFSISQLARYLEKRQRRTRVSGPAAPASVTAEV